MFDQISIRNLGCFPDTEGQISLKPLTLITGPNNAGKSTVFTAFNVVRNLLLGRAIWGSPVIPFSSFNDATNANAGHDITIKLKLGRHPDPVEARFTSNSSRITTDRGRHQTELRELFSNHFVYITFQRTRVAALTQIGREGSIELIEPSGADIIQFYLERFTDRDPLYDVAANWLAKVDPRLTQLKSPLDRSGRASLSTTVTQGTSRFDVNLAFQGLGVQNAAILIAGLLFSPRGSVVLLEEPENHLHPGSQEALVDLANKCVLEDEKQVIMTTHSRNVINPYISDCGLGSKRGSAHVRMDAGMFEMLSFEPSGDGILVTAEDLSKPYRTVSTHLKQLLG